MVSTLFMPSFFEVTRFVKTAVATRHHHLYLVKFLRCGRSELSWERVL